MLSPQLVEEPSRGTVSRSLPVQRTQSAVEICGFICCMCLNVKSIGRYWITRHCGQIPNSVPTSSPIAPAGCSTPFQMPFLVLGLEPFPLPGVPCLFSAGWVPLRHSPMSPLLRAHPLCPAWVRVFLLLWPQSPAILDFLTPSQTLSLLTRAETRIYTPMSAPLPGSVLST